MEKGGRKGKKEGERRAREGKTIPHFGKCACSSPLDTIKEQRRQITFGSFNKFVKPVRVNYILKENTREKKKKRKGNKQRNKRNQIYLVLMLYVCSLRPLGTQDLVTCYNTVKKGKGREDGKGEGIEYSVKKRLQI